MGPNSDDSSPTPAALGEALELSKEILSDIELSRVPLFVAALKAGRLARLMNHSDAQRMFQYEVGGYPSNADGIPPDAFRLALDAGRKIDSIDPKTKEPKILVFMETIEQLEQKIEASKLAMGAAQDPNVSIASANPSQYILNPFGNSVERNNLKLAIEGAAKNLASRRALIYDYAARRHYELRFSDAAQNVFSIVKAGVESRIGELVPDALQKFASVQDNLRSTNPEDWSNAAHSCRRILKDLADVLCPPQAETRKGPGGKEINLGPDNYANRLICFAEDRSDSEVFSGVVGSHLGFLGDRLDAVLDAAHKGTHATLNQEEANRYVIYTYMVVGDLLTLHKGAP